MSSASSSDRPAPWHDPYQGLFPEPGPAFTDLERRFVLATWLAGELGDADLEQALEAVALRIDAGESGARARFERLEERALSIGETHLNWQPVASFPATAPELKRIRMRLRMLACVAHFQDDSPGARQVEELARQIQDGLPHSYERTIESAEIDLTAREELFLEMLIEPEDS
jgi:hypothetical protein